MSPGQATPPSPQGKAIKLFIADPLLAKQTREVLPRLGFNLVQTCAVAANYFQAMRQLYGELMNFDGLVLVNHPPQKLRDSAGLKYEDLSFSDFYKGVASCHQSSRRDVAALLGKCLPILVAAQDSDIRQRIVEDLFPFGIMGVCLLRVQPLNLPWAKQVEERQNELAEYLSDFFAHQSRKLSEFREYKSAAELRERRAKAEALMAEMEELKQAGQFDKAIALCREAIAVLPTDPNPYLEGGRLLVKKRKYPAALQMFRDAEQVAEDLPTPNQEIGNLRVAQAKEYVAQRKEAGLPIEPDRLAGYLGEAVESYRVALAKADAIRALNPDQQRERREEATAAIAENLLSLDLAEALGPQNPFVRELGRLARDALGKEAKGGERARPAHLVQFGLMAFHDGDLEGALRYLFAAAKHQEVFEDACRRLNYIGTQLRQRGRPDEAAKLYQRLLELRPPFRGVVLFNLAVARAASLGEAREPAVLRAAPPWRQSLALAVQAMYVDPALPEDENFYQTRLIAPVLEDASRLFALAVSQADRQNPENEEDRACREARERLDQYLVARRDREALQYLFGLTATLRPFFLRFERHASKPIQRFAERLLPLLAKHEQPKMQVFGKVLEVLVKRGRQGGGEPLPPAADEPALAPVQAALERAEQAEAAHELAAALAERPELLRSPAFLADRNLQNLCREISRKLAGVDFARFKPA